MSSLVNKYGCRAVTIVGAVIAAFGLGISTLAPNVTTLYITIGLVAGKLQSSEASCPKLNSLFNRRLWLRSHLLTCHCERNLLLRAEALVRHGHRSVRLRLRHLHLRPSCWILDHNVLLEGSASHRVGYHAQLRRVRSSFPTAGSRASQEGARRAGRGVREREADGDQRGAGVASEDGERVSGRSERAVAHDEESTSAARSARHGGKRYEQQKVRKSPIAADEKWGKPEQQELGKRFASPKQLGCHVQKGCSLQCVCHELAGI